MTFYRMCSNLVTKQIEWIKIQNDRVIAIAPAYVHAGDNRRQFYDDVKPVTFT